MRSTPATARAKESDSWTLELPPGSRHLINPGSVGQPRDYDWRAAFAIYDSEASSITFPPRALRSDHLPRAAS